MKRTRRIEITRFSRHVTIVESGALANEESRSIDVNLVAQPLDLPSYRAQLALNHNVESRPVKRRFVFGALNLWRMLQRRAKRK